MEINYYDLVAEVPIKMCDPENNPEDAIYARKDESLLPAIVNMHPDEMKFDRTREKQWTKSGSAITKGGRIFFGYCTSVEHNTEDVGGFGRIKYSDDGGKSFQSLFVLEPPVPETVVVLEFVLWIDPMGKLWVFWSQGFGLYDGRYGVWAIRCDDPDAAELKFSAPRRIANGIICSKPIITQKGDWLITTFISSIKILHGLDSTLGERVLLANWIPEEQGASVYRSVDQGETYERIATHIRYPFCTFEEPCIAERNDGSLWMWLRGMNCVAETFSYDGGYTWTTPRQRTDLIVPNSRFNFGRLKSGNLLLLMNYQPRFPSCWAGRNNMTALLSRDDGKTWEGILLLDEREGTEQVCYTEHDDGFLYITYGRAPTVAGEVLMAVVTEADILAGKLVNPKSRLRVVLDKSEGIKNQKDYEWISEFARKYGIDL